VRAELAVELDSLVDRLLVNLQTLLRLELLVADLTEEAWRGDSWRRVSED